MCLLPENEQFAAVDETAEWGAKHLRNNVIPLPTRPVHELEAHVRPEHWVVRDTRLMWSGIDWTMVANGAVMYVSAIVFIVAGMLALGSYFTPETLEQVPAVIGGAL